MSALLPTMRKSHPSWFEIDLSAFYRNLGAIRSRIGAQRLFCFVVKANAYGHGLIPMARAAVASGFVNSFAVAHLQEGVALRRAGISLPILVLGAIHEEQIIHLIEHRLEFSISSLYKAKLVEQIVSDKGCQCLVHAEIDTGMHRTGVRLDSAPALLDYLSSKKCFQLQGVYTHFVSSEVPNESMALQQIERFLQFKEKMSEPAITWHMANSGGVAFYPDSWLDMVRPGLLCYGLSFPLTPMNLQPILSLKANISYFKAVLKDQGISYGHTYRTKGECSRIVTIPVGYGDGYRRDFSNKMSVLIRGQRYPIAGSICMDQFMVDLGQGEAYVGDEVVLIGKQGEHVISLQQMADLAKTDLREILCHFNERIPRVFQSFF